MNFKKSVSWFLCSSFLIGCATSDSKHADKQNLLERLAEAVDRNASERKTLMEYQSLMTPGFAFEVKKINEEANAELLGKADDSKLKTTIDVLDLEYYYLHLKVTRVRQLLKKDKGMMIDKR